MPRASEATPWVTRIIIALTPCKGKSILYRIKNKASALTGRHLLTYFDPGCRFACPGLGAFGLSARTYCCRI